MQWKNLPKCDSFYGDSLFYIMIKLVLIRSYISKSHPSNKICRPNVTHYVIQSALQVLPRCMLVSTQFTTKRTDCIHRAGFVHPEFFFFNYYYSVIPVFQGPKEFTMFLSRVWLTQGALCIFPLVFTGQGRVTPWISYQLIAGPQDKQRQTKGGK